MDYLKKQNFIEKPNLIVHGFKLGIVNTNNNIDIQLLSKSFCELEPKITIFNSYDAALDIFNQEAFDVILISSDEHDICNIINGLKTSSKNNFCPFFVLNSNVNYCEIGAIETFDKNFNYEYLKMKILNILKIMKLQNSSIKDKELFLSVVIHDLKTPINSCMIILKLLLEGKFGEISEQQKETFDNMIAANAFMKELIENLLYKNKLDNSKMVLTKEKASLISSIHNAINLAKQLTKPKNQQIKFDCKIKSAETSYDVLEIERTIMNLISNASDYSNIDTPITITLDEDKDNFFISVADNGSGIDLENCKNIFEQHISYAKKYKKIGSGLGLYIVKKNIEAHQGKINVESKINKGTKITFSLPKIK